MVAPRQHASAAFLRLWRQPASGNYPEGFGRPQHFCEVFEKLERAKGLEPSTPTLARSCSTTELHPHPRWRRTLAVNGRPMPNADRECNSPRAIRCHADKSDFINNWGRIGPKQRLNGVCRPALPEPKIGPPARRRAIRAIFSNQHPNVPCQFVPHAAIEGPWLASTGRRHSCGVPPPCPDDAADICRLNFAAKPPSSG